MNADQLGLDLEPRARHSDPDTSRKAAESVRPHASPLRDAVRAAAQTPGTAEEIAARVEAAHPGRWREGTIVSACAPARGAGLMTVGTTVNARGREVQVLEAVDV